MLIKRQEPNLDFLKYRDQKDFVSVSELKTYKASPYTYFSRYIKQEQEDKRSSAMLFGSLVHCLTLERDKFNSQYFISDIRRDPRTKAYQELLATVGSREVITLAEYNRALNVANSAQKVFDKEGFTDLEYEHSYFYQGPEFFTKAKARFDAFCPSKNVIVDLKTISQLPTYDEVIKTIINFEYHLQAAFYMDIKKAVSGIMPTDFVFVFTMTEFPYAAISYTLSQDFIDIGRNLYRSAHEEIYKALKDKNEEDFPRIKEQPKVLEVPAWYLNKIGNNNFDGIVL